MNSKHDGGTGMNRCPARYRGLSPAQECQLRNFRPGSEGAEKPGGLPAIKSEAAGQRRSIERVRSDTVAMVRSGTVTQSRLVQTMGGMERGRAILADMVASGELAIVRQGAKQFYRVPA